MTVEVRLGLYGTDGKRIEERIGSMVFTHFGVSGPAPLDLSRHILRARLEHPETAYQVCLGHPSLATGRGGRQLAEAPGGAPAPARGLDDGQ